MGDSLGTEAALAQDLKVFRKQFRKDHGRDPSRKDMNKHPTIAATYDEWLAIKSSSQSKASGSGSSSSYKRKAFVESPRLASGSFKGESSTFAMAPPPTTPSKKKVKQNNSYEHTDLYKTPTKKNGSTSKLTPGAASVHDSGGSVVDVPQSPKQVLASPSLSRKQQTITKTVVYESPTKIRDLLSSFSSIHRTPSKSTGKERNAELIGKLKGGTIPAYTPRTKARKRLRGEVVITPEKVRENGKDSEQGSAISRSLAQPAQKRRRGMAMNTLKDYGIVSVAGPRSKVAEVNAGGSMDKVKTVLAIAQDSQNQENGEEEDEDEDEDDDMLGPSPSLNRVVERPIKAGQPLFGVKTNGTPTDESKETEESIKIVDNTLTEKGSTSRSKGLARIDPDYEDQDVVVVPYQRYKREDVNQHDACYSDDDDDIDFYNALPALTTNGNTSNDPTTPPRDTSPAQERTPSLLDSLSLHSPQCKRARNQQRIKAEKSVRHLLGTDESLAILDEWDENEGNISKNELEGTESTAARKEQLPKSNKVGPAIKGGKFLKSAKNFKSILSKETEDKSQREKQSNLVFGNLREQLGSDQDSDVDANDDDDDEWASEVDSADYGLGDGYMSDQD